MNRLCPSSETWVYIVPKWESKSMSFSDGRGEPRADLRSPCPIWRCSEAVGIIVSSEDVADAYPCTELLAPPWPQGGSHDNKQYGPTSSTSNTAACLTPHSLSSSIPNPIPSTCCLPGAVTDNQLPSPAETCYRLNLIYTPTWKPALQLLKIFKLMNWIKMFSPLKYLNYMKFFGNVMDSPVTGFTLFLWSMGDCTTKYCKASTKAIKRLHAGYTDAINAGFSLGFFRNFFRNSVHHEDILEF